MIASISTTLSTALGYTVYYGDMPDAEDGSLDEVVCIYDFPYGKPQHSFGEPAPLITPYGILIEARSASQTDARATCDEVYSALLGLGYLAVSPTIARGRDERGRFIVAAQVEAHEVS